MGSRACEERNIYMKSDMEKPGKLLGKEYSFDLFLAPLAQVANVEKKFPLEWIIEGNKIDDRFFDYAMPLMMDRVPEYAILR